MCKWHGCWNFRSRAGARFALVRSLSLAIGLSGAVSAAFAADDTQLLDVRFEPGTGLVSVSASAVALTDVLRVLGAKTGLQIRVDPAASHQVLQHFQNVPLESAIERLAGAHGALFVYQAADNGAQQLRKVHVMVRQQVLPEAQERSTPDAGMLNEYGRAWLDAHHADFAHLARAKLIGAAISWQKYLSRLPESQRNSLHERMLQARLRREAVDQLAANGTRTGTSVR